MLLPKYTIRQLLIATVFAAFVCAILGFAARGNMFAYGLGIAILGLVVPLATYALMYWTLLAISKAIPGTRLPIGPSTPVPHAHELTKSPAAKQLDPAFGTSSAEIAGSTIDENKS